MRKEIATTAESARPAVAVDALEAPLRLRHATLAARDTAALTLFYDRMRFGPAGAGLVRTTQAVAPAALAAGLFNLAFLLPYRAALGALGARGRLGA